jgi:hypothetical protein
MVAALQPVEQIVTDDVVKPANRALQPAAQGQMQPAGPLLDRGNELLARTRALLGEPPLRTFAAAAPPVREPGPELVRLPMTCSARGGSLVVIAERHGNRLRFIGHEMPRTRQEGQYRPGLLSGEYEIELMQGWACPLCQNNDDAWLCNCAEFYGALHCCGTSGGRYHCACGRFEERDLVKVKKVQVRGASVAATPDKTPSQHGQPPFKQVSYEPNR